MPILSTTPRRILTRHKTKPWQRGDITFKNFGPFQNTAPQSRPLSTAQINDQADNFDMFFPDGQSTGSHGGMPWTVAQRTAMKQRNLRMVSIGYCLDGGVETDDGWFNVVADPATDTFTSVSGLFINWNTNNIVQFSGTSTTPPTASGGNLALATNYYLQNVTAKTFQLSRTSGGAVIDITNAGTSDLQMEITSGGGVQFRRPQEAIFRGGDPYPGATQPVLLNQCISVSSGALAHPNDRIFRCIAAGTTGGSQPTWTTMRRQVYVDGSVTWQEYEPGTMGTGYGVLTRTGQGSNYASPKPWDPRVRIVLGPFYQQIYDAYDAAGETLDGFIMDVMGPSLYRNTTWQQPQPYVARQWRQVGWNREDDGMYLSADLAASMQSYFTKNAAGDWKARDAVGNLTEAPASSDYQVPMGVNGLDTGPAYFARDSGTSGSTAVTVNGSIVSFYEQWFRTMAASQNFSTSNPSLQDFRDCISAIMDIDRRGKFSIVGTHLWPNARARGSLSARWHKFAYATFTIANMTDPTGTGACFFQYRDDNPNDPNTISASDFGKSTRYERHLQFSTNYYTHTIIAATASAGVATFTTFDSHAFGVGQPVVVSGMTPAAYNSGVGGWTVASVSDDAAWPGTPSTFTATIGSTPGNGTVFGKAANIWWDRLALGIPLQFASTEAALEMASSGPGVGVARRKFNTGVCIANGNVSGSDYLYSPVNDGMQAGTYTDIDGVTFSIVTGSDTIPIPFQTGRMLSIT